MKKNSVLLLFAALAFGGATLAGCNQNPTPVNITFGTLFDASQSEEGNFQILTYAQLTSRVKNQSNFILVVYQKGSTCACWVRNFRPTIVSYMQKTNAQIYAIDYNEFTGKDYLGLTVSSTEETVGIFENGSLKYSKTRNGLEDNWANDESVFATWMNARVHLSNMLYVNKTQLETLYAKNDTPFVIGFLRESCGDCSYVDNHLLKTFNGKSHATSYVIDCDAEGIRLFNGAAPSSKADATLDQKAAYLQWALFKDNYGLSNKLDADFGFDTGYVPTWFYCLPKLEHPYDAPHDGDVWVNDSLTANGDGTYRVSNTYFDGKRSLPFLESVPAGVVTNLYEVSTISADDVEVYEGEGYWKHEAAEQYHNPLLQAFLSYYLDSK